MGLPELHLGAQSDILKRNNFYWKCITFLITFGVWAIFLEFLQTFSSRVFKNAFYVTTRNVSIWKTFSGKNYCCFTVFGVLPKIFDIYKKLRHRCQNDTYVSRDKLSGEKPFWKINFFVIFGLQAFFLKVGKFFSAGMTKLCSTFQGNNLKSKFSLKNHSIEKIFWDFELKVFVFLAKSFPPGFWNFVLGDRRNNFMENNSWVTIARVFGTAAKNVLYMLEEHFEEKQSFWEKKNISKTFCGLC